MAWHGVRSREHGSAAWSAAQETSEPLARDIVAAHTACHRRHACAHTPHAGASCGTGGPTMQSTPSSPAGTRPEVDLPQTEIRQTQLENDEGGNSARSETETSPSRAPCRGAPRRTSGCSQPRCPPARTASRPPPHSCALRWGCRVATKRLHRHMRSPPRSPRLCPSNARAPHTVCVPGL